MRGRNGQKRNFGRENGVTANRKKSILKLQYLQKFRSEKLEYFEGLFLSPRFIHSPIFNKIGEMTAGHIG